MSKKFFSILFAACLFFNLAAPALADTGVTTGATLTTNQTVGTTDQSASASEELNEAGTLPDSPFYFVDRLVEKIVLIFTFSPENKASELLQDANERLAESQIMVNEDKQALATKTAQAYVDTLQAAQVQVTIALQDNQVSGSVYSPSTTGATVTSVVYGKKGSSVVAVVYGLDISQRHAAQVLLRVLAKAPEQARKGLMNAFGNVIKHQLTDDSNVTVVVNGQNINLGELLKHNIKNKEDRTTSSTVQRIQVKGQKGDNEKGPKNKKDSPVTNQHFTTPQTLRPAQNEEREQQLNKGDSSKSGNEFGQPQGSRMMQGSDRTSHAKGNSERDD